MSQDIDQVMTKAPKKSGPSLALIMIGIPILTYWIASPYISAWVKTWEASPSGYAVIAQEYPTLSAGLRADVSKTLEKGYLTNDDVNRLVEGIVTEKGSVQTYPAPDFGDGDKSGAGMLDQFLDKRQDSNAKRKLIGISESK